MTNRRHKRLAYGLQWLLPLLLLRALVPVGFMAAPVHGGWQLVVCTGTVGAPTDTGPGHTRQSSGNSPCLFALSAAPALHADAPLGSLVTWISRPIAGLPLAQRLADAGPPRPFSARGPPALT